MSMIGKASLLVLAATVGFGGGMASVGLMQKPAVAHESVAAATSAPHVPHVDNCYAIDGDTLRCGGERIRLIGIDSPEMPGHCREGRHCAPGDPYAAKAALSGSIGASMRIERFGKDHYGRTLALVSGPLGDLSCGQWRSGHAIYREDWDEQGAMMKGCRRRG